MSKDLDQADREFQDHARKKALAKVLDWLPGLVRFPDEADSADTEATLP